MKKDLIVVPASREREIIVKYHESPSTGHCSTIKTALLLARRYLIPKMKRKVRDYCKCFPVCQHSKVEHHKPRGIIQHLEVPLHKWHSISLDFVYPQEEWFCLGLYRELFDSVLTVIDRATKIVHLIPCNSEDDANQHR